MVAKKIKTKRVTLKDKFKVIKRVTQHNAKVRKAQKNKTLPRKKFRDPGVPNSWHAKAEVLMDAKEARESMAREKKEMKKKKMASMEDYAASAEAAKDSFGNEAMEDEGLDEDLSPLKRRKCPYIAQARSVIERSDVVLEVLDARDPNGCRDREAEDEVVAAGKHLVLVVNKSDLIPREIASAWYDQLSKDHPTVLFKAMTNLKTQFKKIYQNPLHSSPGLLESSKCVGREALLQLLKNYSLNKSGILVGVVGQPNVGKSSVIASIRRGPLLSVGGQPGTTRQIQELVVDSRLRIIDTPGVLTSAANTHAAILRNAVKIQNLANPVSIVEDVIKNIPPHQLMMDLCVPEYEGVTDLLSSLASVRGLFSRQGKPNLDAAARSLLRDISIGKIQYYSKPV